MAITEDQLFLLLSLSAGRSVGYPSSGKMLDLVQLKPEVDEARINELAQEMFDEYRYNTLSDAADILCAGADAGFTWSEDIQKRFGCCIDDEGVYGYAVDGYVTDSFCGWLNEC